MKNKIQNNNFIIDLLIKQSTITSQINYLVNLNNSTETEYLFSEISFNSISESIENIINRLNSEIKELTEIINEKIQEKQEQEKQEQEKEVVNNV